MQTQQRKDLLPMLAELDTSNFEQAALAVFRYQSVRNPLYKRFLELLGRNPLNVNTLTEIPFLPISLFKNHDIQSGDWAPQTIFTSSGTTGQIPSRHLVRDLASYLDNTRRGFAQYYDDPANYCVLALLPSYLERSGSSLVAMADYFIRQSKYSESGFFLNDLEKLRDTLLICREKGYKTLLLGVSFALLDFAEVFPMDLNGITIMETGGMKGRRQEITRSELHETLIQAFQVTEIHSEYGMTELLSQAYASGGSHFHPASTLCAFVTEINDPFHVIPHGRTGLLNLIDLANLDTGSFIATEDLGKTFADGTFEVLGRLDAAELRGCNLLLEG